MHHQASNHFSDTSFYLVRKRSRQESPRVIGQVAGDAPEPGHFPKCGIAATTRGLDVEIPGRLSAIGDQLHTPAVILEP